MDELFDLTVITHDKDTQACVALHAVAKTNGLRRERIVHSSALSAYLSMVLDGLGVALLPERLVAADVTVGNLAEIQSDWLPDPLPFHAYCAPACSARYIEKAARIAKSAMQQR